MHTVERNEAEVPRLRSGCNTVPIEKGTETEKSTRSLIGPGLGALQQRPHREGDSNWRGLCGQHSYSNARHNTVPIEKGTETLKTRERARAPLRRLMQHRPHREGD